MARIIFDNWAIILRSDDIPVGALPILGNKYRIGGHMDEILRKLDGHIRRLLKEVHPKFVSIVITVDEKDFADLVDEYPKRSAANIIEFCYNVEGWPKSAMLTFMGHDEDGPD